MYADKLDVFNRNPLENTLLSYFNRLDALVHGVETCKELMEDKTLSDYGYYDKLIDVVKILLEEDDYTEIISVKTGNHYHGKKTLKTSMVRILADYEDADKDNVYGEEEYLVNLRVFYSEYLDSDHIYSKKEIQNLIDEGIIVVIGEIFEGKNKTLNSYDGPCEEYEKFEPLSKSDFLEKDGKYYFETIRYIHNHMLGDTMDRIYEDLLLTAQNEMNTVKDFMAELKASKLEKRLDNISQSK